ncbi:Gfo/Idh/MocA family oxidoreductase [Crocosphaera sp. XPORK-15E]|uniref:Gfo/Idh/MocA family protein n=1 Tax=Crocosphaera sp. XPORK-15E TaxID=3110247 RepID=UPI002B20AD99|nr:Gfo/Idh/MocA family oxidoreductase [Crocosphaera sp. XPORK-15E]MEA5533123.1 Gfo/Idh/MocA family oxidoreductase [Crocosphaera sp. XPORK-15E]
MSLTPQISQSCPLKVGIVGTGYAAQRRAETFLQDERSQLCLVTGHTPEKLSNFCQLYSISACETWEELVTDKNIDLVVICTINRDHGKIAKAALKAGKHIVIEYPLSLDVAEGLELLKLAKENGTLLHIEHIEILGGMHQAIRQYLPEIGTVFFGRYTTIDSKNPAPHHWTFDHLMFGFPFKAALPRIHRFTDLLGEVNTITCHDRYWEAEESGYYKACLCDAQLQFKNGVIVDLIYGKGENFVTSDRIFELYGDQGKIIFSGMEGNLITKDGTKPIELESRRGLFAKDTTLVLDHLFEGKPLYIQPESSLYALKIAEAALQSARLGETVKIN